MNQVKWVNCKFIVQHQEKGGFTLLLAINLGISGVYVWSE